MDVFGCVLNVFRVDVWLLVVSREGFSFVSWWLCLCGSARAFDLLPRVALALSLTVLLVPSAAFVDPPGRWPVDG